MLLPEQGDPPAAASVVDSWLVVDGRSRAANLHGERFQRSCAELLPDLAQHDVREFLEAVSTALPTSGRWWPRVEAYAAPHVDEVDAYAARDVATHAGLQHRLRLWLRPAPAPRREVTLWTPSVSDPRRHPRAKGPDLQVLARLCDEARSAGGDDAVLCRPDGMIVETARAAIAWWRGDTLCVPSLELPAFPSVTLRLLTRAAAEQGVRIQHERCAVHELDGLEVWTLNALHGIRAVTGWAGTPGLHTPPANRARLAHWRQALDASAAALLEPTQATSTERAR